MMKFSHNLRFLLCVNPLIHTDDIWHLPLNISFKNISIKGDIAQNEQFHILLQYFQLFININLSVFEIFEIGPLMIVKSCELMGLELYMYFHFTDISGIDLSVGGKGLKDLKINKKEIAESHVVL